ncbi:unnamed protein product [Orchesella dallaii]|uniref:BSD domain-containing protein n=1 Tax=Orchesella dallaii TaxID=48710 RepID=A0ABP1QMN6_9HEXA
MLSGLTSQLGGLMGKKAPPEEAAGGGESNANSTAPTAAGGDTSTPAGADGTASSTASSVLTSVTNSIKLPSWSMFGGAKKDEEPTAATEATESTPAPSQEPPAERGRITPDKGSDGSSATGGADSDKEVRKTNKVPPEIPEEDPAAESTAAAGLGKVKSLGMSLFSSIKGAGQKIKDTNILSEFQKEHDSFLKSRGSKGDAALAPWVGHPKEDALKEEILSLSTDRRNFVRSPPSGVSFEWDWEQMAPIAKAILKDDPNLEKMRYDLVPKVVSEENFWRNYFYRVTLLKESMSEDESGKKKRDSIDTDEEDIEKELNEELKSFEVVDSSSAKKSEVDEKELDSLLDLK